MGRYDLQMVPDPSSPTGFSARYVYVPETPIDRARQQISEIGRQFGLAARYGAEGIAGTVGIVTNPLAAMGAAATGDMRNFVPLQEQVSQGLTALGVPNPRGAVEQSVAGLSRAVAGAGGVAGASRAAVPLAQGALGRSTLTELAAMPGRQVAAGATSEGARQLAEAGGAGPIGQTVAAVAGGAVPFAGAPAAMQSIADDFRPRGSVSAMGGRPSPFDYAATDAARPMAERPARPTPQTYEEAADQVAALQTELDAATRDTMARGSARTLRGGIENPNATRAQDRRAAIEADLAAARADLERLRPAPPERQNAPGTSEAARAYLERLGMGRVAELGSTRAAEPASTKQTSAIRAALKAGDALGFDRNYTRGLIKFGQEGMTPEARMTRAREMGFDVDRPLYHGTSADIRGFELGRRGETFSEGRAVYASDAPEVAATYAEADRVTQDLQLLINELERSNARDADVRPLRKALVDRVDEIQAAWRAAGMPFRTQAGEPSLADQYEGGAIYPLVSRAQNPMRVDAQGRPFNAPSVDVPGLERQARAQGVNALEVANVKDLARPAFEGESGLGTTVATFDPAMLRSPMATFDPARMNRTDLLAMQRGQRPPGDINAQTETLLGAIGRQAEGLPPRLGTAEFRTGQGITRDDPRRLTGARRRGPAAPAPLEPVRAEQAPPVSPLPTQVQMANPSELIFRETTQNRLPEVRAMFPPGEGYYPVVAVKTPQGLEIIDGHNRARVASERGDDIPMVVVPQSTYDKLKADFDDMEIAYAALSAAKQSDAAQSLDTQFKGARVAERGLDALDAAMEDR